MVLDRTTEEGRLFQTGIVLGKRNFSGHHYRQMVLCIVIHVMPEYALDWVPGSGICLYQETLYRCVSCRRRLRRTAPCETPGMATQVGDTITRNHRNHRGITGITGITTGITGITTGITGITTEITGITI